MKKIVFAIAGLLLLAVVADFGTTYYFSRHAEKKVAEWTQKLEAAAPYLKISSDYQRGFLISTQRITIGLIGGKAGSDSIVLKNVIHHGPFPGFNGLGMARIEHSWEFDQATQTELAKGFGASQPFVATTTIALDGSGTTELKGAPANYSSGEDKVAWQGITGTLRFSKGMESYSGEIAAPQFSAVGKQGTVNMSGLVFSFDQRRMPGFEDLYLGKMKVSLDGVSVKDGTTDAKLEKMVFEADASSADNQFMDIKGAFTMAKLSSVEVEAADVDYTISMRHLHAQSLMQLSRAVRDAGPRPDAAKQDAAALMAQMAAMQAAMKVHALALLKYEPVISIDRINLKMKDGEVKASGMIRLPGVTDADMEQPFNLIGKIDAAATVSVSEAFARTQYAQTKVRQLKAQQGSVSDAQATEVAAAAGSEFAQLLAAFAQQGYVDSEGGQLKSKIAFKGGALTVNDKPFNPMAAAPPPTLPAAPTSLRSPFSPKPPVAVRQ